MNNRRRIQGEVIANKNDKTICIQVSGYKKHSKYLKRVQHRAKYYAHDEENAAKLGDIVTIEECRPMSKTKRFKLISVDVKALEKIEVSEENSVTEVLAKKEKEAKVEEAEVKEEE